MRKSLSLRRLKIRNETLYVKLNTQPYLSKNFCPYKKGFPLRLPLHIFPLRISSVNVIKSAVPGDLVTFTEEILNRKVHFLCDIL